MRVGVLFVFLMAGCVGDHSVTERFLVVSPVSIGPDSQQALAAHLLQRVAQRHGMRAAPTRDCQAHYWMFSDGAELIICLTVPRPDAIAVTVSESFATEWGPQGDSVRRELGDSLRALFGKKAIKG
jgi:hypothetical protein